MDKDGGFWSIEKIIEFIYIRANQLIRTLFRRRSFALIHPRKAGELVFARLLHV